MKRVQFAWTSPTDGYDQSMLLILNRASKDLESSFLVVTLCSYINMINLIQSSTNVVLN